jgi:hypothetical protein
MLELDAGEAVEFSRVQAGGGGGTGFTGGGGFDEFGVGNPATMTMAATSATLLMPTTRRGSRRSML